MPRMKADRPRTRLEGRQWVNYDNLFLVPQDLLDIGHALRREFPQLMFWPIDADEHQELIGDRWDVVDGRIVDTKGDPARRVPKPPSEWKSKLTPDPAGILRSWRTYCWISPPDWAPEWAVQTDGTPVVANAPDLIFTITRSLFWGSRLGVTNAISPRMISQSEHVELGNGAFFGNFWPWEEEKGAFLKRCKTIFRRHTTSRYVRVRDDGRIRQISDKETARDGRVGFHAIKWARSDPRHFFFEDCKPVDWQEPAAPTRIRFPRWPPD